MKNIKLIFLWIAIAISSSKCSLIKEKLILKGSNKYFNQAKESFLDNYHTSNLLRFFPERITDTSSSSFSAPPTCPPDFECLEQFGELYLFHDINKFDHIPLLFDSVIFETSYNNPSNFIINQHEFGKVKMVNDKTNIYYANKFPIPCFENYDFDLGKISQERILNEDIYYQNIYNIPDDLMVYVSDAKAGDFWKVQCNEERPESLKQWKHGHAAGFAISENMDLIIFWAMIW